ncbi:hypothetical protein CYCME_1284 [Cycloclasticus zancles 78-ME]|uniref:Uncharacterized protein n=1 Tax=Cycloclasticus zancles 78-ME TaxID=1198232 RepID=S5TX91_9GAMM|nr:hypothetical protein CYCME_1284 [Cycloclasticus zancles 78-ME]SHJ71823.1 hypothetical protein SAMN05519226_0091 [Cycloclasticus pugetii]
MVSKITIEFMGILETTPPMENMTGIFILGLEGYDII